MSVYTRDMRLVGLIILGLVLGASSHGRTPKSPASGPGESKRTPVLVELFTSEGCSSCPPADALLARLEKVQPVPGAEVIALKEHVDYWNHLGWRDPYSSAQFSARQDEYAQALGNSTVYTPQMIVDGRAEFVGSAEDRAWRAIGQATQASKAVVELKWARPSTAATAAAVLLQIRIEQLDGASRGDVTEVYLAITEDYLHSDVTRGENAGRKLDHMAVVRELKLIGKANPQAVPAFIAQPIVTVASGWKREHLRAVVFVQERRSRRVLAAAAIRATDE
jgi:hypothetical protein